MGVWLKRAAAALSALALLLAAPALAQVPDLFARDLAQKLDRAEAVLRANGYMRAAGPFAGGLEPRRAARFTITLRAGQDYRIVGVCDVNCGDLDLRLYDPNNVMIGQDTLEDSVPVVHVRPNVTGAYTVEAIMYRCGEPTCWYAFNVYSR